MSEFAEVPGDGPRDAKVMIVGEAPANEEFKTGKPFMGKAGDQLNELLAAAGLNRSQVYCTNASLEKAGWDKDKHFFDGSKPSAAHIRGMAQLVKDVQEIKPNVIVALGNYALWTTLQVGGVPPRGIMHYRGSIMWSELFKTKVVPTIHPAALLRGKVDDGDAKGGLWKYRNPVIWDLRRAAEQSKFPEYKPRKRDIWIIEGPNERRDQAIERLQKAKQLVMDIESFGGTDLACIGLNDGDPEWAAVFVCYNSNENREVCKALLESDVPKWGQNLMYDATMLDQNNIFMRNIEHDTMLAQHVLLVELPKSLPFMTSIYTDIPYYKDEGKIWKKPKTPQLLTQYWNYNGKDVCATAEIVPIQLEELAEAKLMDVYNEERAAFEPMRQATTRGEACNLALLDKMVMEHQAEANKYQIELEKLAGHPVNVNSPIQVKSLLYDERKLPTRHKHGKVTTNARVLQDLAAKTQDPALGLVMKIREERKFVSTHQRDKVVSKDGRIRSNYNLAGTTSGRYSSDAPLWGPGWNGQNVQPESREIIIADPGFEYAEFDQVQAEAVLVAYLADDPVHIDCFRTGKDVHRVTACLLLGKPLDQWETIPKKSPVRDLYKRANHAFNYFMGPDTFMMINNMYYDPLHPENCIILTQTTARQFHAEYLRARPALNNYWEGIKRELKMSKTLTTPLGRKRVFLDQWSDSMLRIAFSYKPQSCVGDQTTRAINRVWRDEEMRRMDVRITGQVHDSIKMQWPKDHRADVMKRMWGLLETELYINGYRVIVPWDGSVGPTWYKGNHESLGQSRISCEV